MIFQLGLVNESFEVIHVFRKMFQLTSREQFAPNRV